MVGLMERPILFNDAMVRAILSGAKTQTRRPVKSARAGDAFCAHGIEGRHVFASSEAWAMKYASDPSNGELCPFGAPGDLLWVRECFGIFDRTGFGGREGYAVAYRADELDGVDRGVQWIDGPEDWTEERWKADSKWRPSIHMPRWASRLVLRVTDVRVERVKDITNRDATADLGASPITRDCKVPKFARIWDEVYGTWAANPWVWVVGFEVVR